MREKIIDFHSHILPEVDDGSSSLEESIAMLRLVADQGIRHVVATPHFYAQHDTAEGFVARRAEAELRLREEMKKHKGLPKLSIGAEVHFFRGISQAALLQELTIDGKKCTLIEMPHTVWTDGMYQELERIYTERGIVPIIAHVDRYFGRFRTYGIPERWADLPVLVQANGSFFCHRSTAPRALRMLQRQQIHLLGSDCHNTYSRVPNLGRALDVICKQADASVLSHICAAQEIVFNETHIY